MRRRILTLVVLACGCGPVWAECPPAPDHSELQDHIYDQLRQAKNELSARPLMGLLWSLWKDAPDAKAQDMLDVGVSQIRVANYSGAIETLNELVTYCPNYAEGYNQRAFAYYLQNDFANALPDLDKAIALSPGHTAARSGRFLTLVGMGRPELAQNELRTALDMNPWLPERRYLVQPQGQEL